MRCPVCEGKTKVTDSRHSHYAHKDYRKRYCQPCDYTFTTYEITPEQLMDLFEGEETKIDQEFPEIMRRVENIKWMSS